MNEIVVYQSDKTMLSRGHYEKQH